MLFIKTIRVSYFDMTISNYIILNLFPFQCNYFNNAIAINIDATDAEVI